MNYLGHFVFNHDVCRCEPEPYFVMGVALPDLWPRFSRTRRISWKAVRAERSCDGVDAGLRAGLLNHVEVDRRFHALPAFLRWQQELKAAVGDGHTHSMLLDFLAHVAVELVLDQQLVRGDGTLVERFYDRLAACDLETVEQRIGVLGQVDAGGLRDEIRGFLGRRYLHHFRTRSGLLTVMQRVLELTTVRAPASGRLTECLLEHAAGIVDPGQVWAELKPQCAAELAS